MRLSELKPKFVRYDIREEEYSVVDGDQETWRERGSPTKKVIGPRVYVVGVESLAQAHGIWFLCPLCFAANKGEAGTHHCEVTFAGREVPAIAGTHDSDGKPVRWSVFGKTFEDLSVTPSIQLICGCAWHGYITKGEVT